MAVLKYNMILIYILFLFNFCESQKGKPGEYIAPQRDDLYNPQHGYETYWRGGDWVYVRPKTDDSNDNCGFACSPFYKMYGKICARNHEYTYRTFENYCKLMSTDCRGYFEWRALYRGECITEIYLKNTLHYQMAYTYREVLKGAAVSQMATFYNKYPSRSSTALPKHVAEKRARSSSLAAYKATSIASWMDQEAIKAYKASQG